MTDQQTTDQRLSAHDAGEAAVRAYKLTHPKPEEPTLPRLSRPSIVHLQNEARLWIEIKQGRYSYELQPKILICQTDTHDRTEIAPEELLALRDEIVHIIADYDLATRGAQDYEHYQKAVHQWEERLANVRRAAELAWVRERGKSVSPDDEEEFDDEEGNDNDDD